MYSRFFGYNKNLELQYRGRLRELKNLIPVREGESDLFKAMKQIGQTGKGPENQTPSAGCSISGKIINVFNCNKIFSPRIRGYAKFNVGS